MIPQVTVITIPTAVVLAAETTGTGFDISSIIGTVVTPVVVLMLLIMGKLRTENEIKNRDETIAILRQQVKDKDAQLDRLQEGLVDKAIPALTRAALILEKISPESISPVSRDR